MLTARSILCPVDFSEQSRRALIWASAIAQHRGGELTVIFVGEPLLTQAATIVLGVDLKQAEIRPALRLFVEASLSAGARQRAPVRLLVAVGDPAEVILRTARRQKVRMIVMGTHGRGGVRKLLLGSTTEQVLRQTSCPVLAVPAKAKATPADRTGLSDVKGILLATDFRDSATAAAQWAADLAFDLRVRLVVAHVVEPVDLPRRWRVLAADLDDDRVASTRARLQRLAANLAEANTSSVLAVGAPAQSIAAMTREQGAGLVVMGLGADDSDQSPGAIAYRVLRLADVPLLVVPARTIRPHTKRPPTRPAGTHDECHSAHAARARAATFRGNASVRQPDGAVGPSAR